MAQNVATIRVTPTQSNHSWAVLFDGQSVSGLGRGVGAGVDVQVALPHLPAFPGLCLLPPLRAPGLLPPPDGTPRPRDPAAAGEHLLGKEPPARGQTKGPVCGLGPGQDGAPVSGEQKLYLPLVEAADKSQGRAGTMPACLGTCGPNPARGSASVLLCSPKGLAAPARTPTMPRSCWQCLGAVRWTLPRWGLLCGTFVQRPPFTGPDEQRVSWGRLCGGAWAPAGQSVAGWGRSPLGIMEAPPPRAPEAAADLPMHRHLLPEQHLYVRLLLLPPGLSPCSAAPQASQLAGAITSPRRVAAGGANKQLHLAMTVSSVASGHETVAGRGRRRHWLGGGHQPRIPLSGPRPCGSRISEGDASCLGWAS